MYCARCKKSFCWCCMGTQEEKDKRCWCGFPMCPMLPFNSLCTNLLLTLVAFIICPVVMAVGPFIYAVVIGIYYAPKYIIKHCSGCNSNAGIVLLAIIVSWVIILPILIVLAAIAAALAVVFGTLMFWFCCFCYLIIVTKNICRFVKR